MRGLGFHDRLRDNLTMRCESRSSLMLAIVLACCVIPSFAQAQQPSRLTVKEAIQLGLKANLSVLVSEAKTGEAAGTRQRFFSNLLPRSYIETSLTLEKINLAALGLNFPHVNPAVG